jgi:CHAT domain
MTYNLKRNHWGAKGMESTAKPFQDFEIRIFRAEGPADDTSPFVESLSLPNVPPVALTPPVYTAELSCSEGYRSVCELGPLPPASELATLVDPLAHGQRLFHWLFPPDFAREIESSLDCAPDTPAPGLFGTDPSHTRLRLTLDARDPDLHNVWWETLVEPAPGVLPLAVQNPFSRFLRLRAARGWPISERPLRMVTFISNPRGLSDFNLSAFDESFHKQMLTQVARPLGPVLDLGHPIYNPSPRDLGAVMSKPAGKEFHIVHIVAYSMVENDRAFLLLADEHGSAQQVPAEVVRDAIKSVIPPYLVFLATPITRGGTDGTGLMRLAPMLLASGVQAVVVIPGVMDANALARFTEEFYDVLLRTGTIDRAMSEARRKLYDDAGSGPDWARPVLYMRTPDAQLFLELPEAFESSISKVAFARG